MATVRTMSSAAKLFIFKNAILPFSLKLSPVYLKPIATQSNVPARWASYGRGQKMDSREVQTEVEVVNDPVAWAIVERLAAKPVIPFPTPKDEYPSGWKPPKVNENLPYFVQRTCNHMHSVHMSFDRRTVVRKTVLRRVQGDIWALEKDLKAYLVRVEKNRHISSAVHEAFGKIYFRGDHESNIKVWLEKQGF